MRTVFLKISSPILPKGPEQASSFRRLLGAVDTVRNVRALNALSCIGAPGESATSRRHRHRHPNPFQLSSVHNVPPGRAKPLAYTIPSSTALVSAGPSGGRAAARADPNSQKEGGRTLLIPSSWERGRNMLGHSKLKLSRRGVPTVSYLPSRITA
jgi:hypothetical protein